VERELRDRYGSSYCVRGTRSSDEALEILARLSNESQEVALVLAAQRLSATTGGELLARVRELHPHAKRGLLVPPGAWADQPTAEAIRDSMALVRGPAGGLPG
jgi:thioredoxin reductase (NADPH)